MALLSIKRLNVLPDPLEASTIYITKNASNAALVDMTFVGNLITDVRRLPGLPDMQEAIDAAINGLTAAQIPDLPGSKITSAVAEATHALSADTATNADHATTADTATHADTAVNATYAGQLSTPRAINGTNFDGTQNITISAQDDNTPRVAVADVGITVAPLSGGKIPVEFLPNGLDNIDTYPTQADFPAVGASDTIYIAEDVNAMFRWANGAPGSYVLIPSGAGVAETALRLATARVIALTGDAAGSVAFDGSENVEIAVTLADVVVAGEQAPVVTVDAKGRVLSSRALVAGDVPDLPGSKINSAVANATLAAAATKLATARTISVTGPLSGSATFDGSGDATIALTGSGATGTSAKVTYEGGLVTGGSALLVADIPDLPGSKISSAVAEALHATTADNLTVTAEW